MRNMLVALMLLWAQAAWAQPVFGVVGALSGTAWVTPRAASTATQVKLGQQVREGTLLQTGANARLRLDLADGTALTLGEATSIRLDHLTGAHNISPTRITQIIGFLRALVAPQHGPAGLEIDTDTVVAAVRGTEWIQHVVRGSTEVFVAAGHVALRLPGSGATGPIVSQLAPDGVTLAPGEGVTFLADGPITAPTARGLRAAPGVVAAPTHGPTHTDVVQWQPAKIAAFDAATRLP